MSVKPLIKYHLEFQSLAGGSTGSSECTLAKTPHCWKSHVAAQLFCRLLILDLLHTADGSVKEGNVLRVLDEYLLLYEAC